MRAGHAAVAMILCAAGMVMSGVAEPAYADVSPTCDGQPATIMGTDGDDILSGDDHHRQVVSLGPGNDRYTGGSAMDIVCGGPGDDVIYGGYGKDYLFGEAGDDALDGGYHSDHIVGGPGDDIIHGGDGWDAIVADDIDPTLGDGSDQIDGGPGSDAIYGQLGMGVDSIDGGEGKADRDFLSFGSQSGGVDVDVAQGTATGTGAGDVVDHVTHVEGFGGTTHADHLVGGSGDDYLQGFSGDDVLSGGRGDDILRASQGIVHAGPGDDGFVTDEVPRTGLTVYLGDGDDAAVFDIATDTTIHGERGDDSFEFSSSILDTSGASTSSLHLDGGVGTDALSFRNYDGFPVRFDARSHTATWSDSALTFSHLDVFRGSDLDDLMIGSAGTDRFHGGLGDDVMSGQAGRDVLRGAEGTDTALGGAGRDACTAEHRVSCETR